MDQQTGRIYSETELMNMFKATSLGDAILKAKIIGKKFMPLDGIASQHLQKAMARRPPKVGRNDPCPCGSGKKFKKCCLFQNWKERFNA